MIIRHSSGICGVRAEACSGSGSQGAICGKSDRQAGAAALQNHEPEYALADGA